LIVLDLMLPRMSGLEVCKLLRADSLTSHIPIIMLTAKGLPDDKVSGLEGGANDYVTKPWDQKELMLRIRNVLEWSRQQRSASPLTGLPGNLSINDEIKRRLALPDPFALLQIDIDYFKAFNDYYGYARGDDAIKRLSEILINAALRHGGSGNFVGHIGGDDFVVVSAPEFAEALGEDIITQFNTAVTAMYDEEDLTRGYIEVRNRRHQPERFPPMSLTIALVRTDKMPVSHLAQLIDVAQELKAHGKGIPGSVVVGERRRPPDAEAERNVA
jgi:diguanylate cyclase (GGDEF)-like protein